MSCANLCVDMPMFSLESSIDLNLHSFFSIHSNLKFSFFPKLGGIGENGMRFDKIYTNTSKM